LFQADKELSIDRKTLYDILVYMAAPLLPCEVKAMLGLFNL